MKETDTLSQENNLELAIDAIRNGEVVGIPTETVYGIGVDPYSQTAVDKIFSLKERSEKKPLSILISSFHEIQKLNRSLFLAKCSILSRISLSTDE